jgi:hypothetical protein
MSTSWDDLLKDLETKGYDPEDIDRIRKSSDASGLRQDLKTAKDEAKTAREKAKRYEDAVLAAKLKDKNVTANPAYLVRPDDLDISDEEAVNKWLTDAGLWTPTPNAPATELEAHDRAANLAAGDAAPRTPIDEKKAKLMSDQSLTEEQFYSLAREIGATT